MKIEWFIASELEMQVFGKQLASVLKAPLFLALEGQLGAGKTTLVRAILRGFGYMGTVKSPTYTLVESYELPEVQIFHLDLYRVKQPQELEFLGIEEIFQANALCVVEWPQLGEHFLPKPDVACKIDIIDIEKDCRRHLQMESLSEKGDQLLTAFYTRST